MEPKISVVIPIYNGGSYIRKCFDSLLNQTLKEIEIIAVDDGSTDEETILILDEYIDADPRLRIVHQLNHGAGYAINRGMEIAKGIYFCEQDQDDWREPDALEILWDASENGRMDVVKGSWRGHQKGQTIEVKNWPEVWHNESVMPLALDMKHLSMLISSPPTVWTGIYKFEFLKEYRIDWSETPGAKYQDTAFGLKTKTFAGSFKMLNTPVCEYRMDNPGSASAHPVDGFAIAEQFDSYEHMLKEYSVSIWPVVARQRFDSYTWALMRMLPEDRELFMVRAAEDFRRDAQNRSLYTDPEWEWLQVIINRR